MKERRGVGTWIIVGVIVLLGAMFIYDMSTREPSKSAHVGTGPWNERTTAGQKDAPNTFIVYSDYFCPYCAEAHKAIEESSFKQDYIDSGKIRMETRLVTVLKDISPNTEQGVEAGYCAADQDKFTAYSNHIMPRIKKDYFDKGIGVKTVAVPVPIEKLPLSYFNESATAVGMDVAAFEDCMTSGTHRERIRQDTNRAMTAGVSGLPYFAVNSYEMNGFSGGYAGLKAILKAGGVQ